MTEPIDPKWFEKYRKIGEEAARTGEYQWPVRDPDDPIQNAALEMLRKYHFEGGPSPVELLEAAVEQRWPTNEST